MFKKTLLAVTLVGLSSAAAVSHAEEPEAQAYLFASAGQSDADVKSDLDDFWGVPGGVSSSVDKDTAWRIGAGIKLNQYVAFEVEYIDLGDADYKAGNDVVTTNLATDGYGLNTVLTLPLDRFSLFGKLGYHRLETETKLGITGLGSASDSSSDWVTSFGVGAGYDLTDNFTLVAEFERFRGVAASFDIDSYDVDLMSAGLRYNF